MRTLFQKLEKTFADAALLEMGINLYPSPEAAKHSFKESLEEEFIEVAFAEAADYEDIRQAILREHEDPNDRIHPDDCQYGDNDMCLKHAA
jgi:hypothetical protein